MTVMEQEIRFCRSSDGTKLAYAIAGSGPPLLLVGSWMNVSHLGDDWEPGSPFRPILEALAEEFTLARYDPRGTGLSDRTVDDHSLGAQLADLEAIVAALELPRLAMLGVHLGGAVAVSYAARHPARLTRLIVYHATPYGPALVDDEQRDALRTLMQAHFGVAARAWAEWFAPSRADDGQFVTQLTESIRRAVSMEHAVAIFEVQQRVDVREQLAAVSVPTLVVHASGNRVMPIDHAHEVASDIPGARLVALEGEDDIPVTPAAIEGLVRAIRPFIAEPTEDVRSLSEANPPLTPREHDVLVRIAEGRTNRAIAHELGISVYTVNRHVSSLLAKTGAANRAEAVRWAADRGMLA
jgi:pimeloyl-ACP methyl ester carboxylesterase/DNA-binding CsgD family transcriptional regulator